MSREERETCRVSTWQLPATESFKQIHLARSDMKSRLQVPGSPGLPKLTDWQQKESASKSRTAQSPSMVHWGGKAVGKGRQARAQSQVQDLLYRQNGMKRFHFFPSATKTFPTPGCSFCYEGSPSARTPPKVHAVPAPSSSPWPFPPLS